MDFLYFVLLYTLATCSLVVTYPAHKDQPLSDCGKHLLIFINYVCKSYLDERNSTVDTNNAFVIDCCVKECTVKRIEKNFCPREEIAITTEKSYEIMSSSNESKVTDSTTVSIINPEEKISTVHELDNGKWYANIDKWFNSVNKKEE